MTSKARAGVSRSLPDSERITDPERMARLLERLAKRYTPLTIEIPGYEERYTSCIVGVDRPYVLLDELQPASGTPLLLAERALQVTGKLEGIDIRFVTTLDRVDEQDDMVTCYINLPGQLEYRQRRMDYRAHIPMARRLRVIIENSSGKVAEGVLHDLSQGGAGMIFPDGDPVVESGLLHECAIELPDAGWLFCVVELRYSKNITSRDRQLIGARFAGLTPVQVRLLGHCISELDREYIRKRTAD